MHASAPGLGRGKMEKWPTKATVSLNSAFLIYKVGANRYQVPMTVCQALDVLALSSPPPPPKHLRRQVPPVSCFAAEDTGIQRLHQRLVGTCSGCMERTELSPTSTFPPSWALPPWQMSPQSERDNRRECSAADQELHRCMTSWLLIMEAAQLIHDPSRWTT